MARIARPRVGATLLPLLTAAVMAVAGCGPQEPSPKAAAPAPAPPAPATVNGQVFVVTKGGLSIKLALVHVFAVPEAEVKARLSSPAREAIERSDKILAEHLAASKAAEAAQALAAGAAKRRADAQRAWESAPISAIDVSDRLSAAVAAAEKSLEPYRAARARADKALDAFLAMDSLQAVEAAARAVTHTAKTDADGKFSLKVPGAGKYLLFARAQRLAGSVTEKYDWLVWVDAAATPVDVMLSNDNMSTTNCASCLTLRKLAEMAGDVVAPPPKENQPS